MMFLYLLQRLKYDTSWEFNFELLYCFAQPDLSKLIATIEFEFSKTKISESCSDTSNNFIDYAMLLVSALNPNCSQYTMDRKSSRNAVSISL